MMRDTLKINYGQNRKVVFQIPQGIDVNLPVHWKIKATNAAADFTGYTFHCQIRAGYADKDSVIIRSISETENGAGDSIEAVRDEGRIVIKLSAETTREFKPDKNYYLELKLIAPDGTVPRRILATLEIMPEVARV